MVELGCVVRDDDLESAARWILLPVQVLLYGDGQPRRQRAGDAIGPAAVLWICVVGVEQHPLPGAEPARRERGAR
jgi:hypothetical protein